MEMKQNNIQAEFVSVWDGGIEIETPCKVNLETKEVYDIGRYSGNLLEMLERLEKEYVRIAGVDYPVFQVSDITEEDDEYWYDT